MYREGPTLLMTERNTRVYTYKHMRAINLDEADLR